MTASLHIVYPEIPPTSNKLYFRGTRLMPEAREYKRRFSAFMAQNYLPQISELRPDAIYALHLRFFLPELVYASYNNPQVPKSKRAKTRYKRIDLSNRVKLLEDCIRDALAIDDCQTFAASQEKHQDPSRPRVEIFLQAVRPEDFGLPKEPFER